MGLCWQSASSFCRPARNYRMWMINVRTKKKATKDRISKMKTTQERGPKVNHRKEKRPKLLRSNLKIADRTAAAVRIRITMTIPAAVLAVMMKTVMMVTLMTVAAIMIIATMITVVRITATTEAAAAPAAVEVEAEARIDERILAEEKPPQEFLMGLYL